jgi:hypothetical protein
MGSGTRRSFASLTGQCAIHQIHLYFSEKPLVVPLRMGAGRRCGKPPATATPRTLRADTPAPPADLVQAARHDRATYSVVVAPPLPASPPRRRERPGKAGGRRKTANRRSLPRLRVFLIRGRRASRWKTAAEPVTRTATNQPRFPGRRPGGKKESPPSVPDTNPPEAEPGICPWQEARAMAPTPAARLRSQPGAVGPPPVHASARVRPGWGS